jgi:hypothetical protein
VTWYILVLHLSFLIYLFVVLYQNEIRLLFIKGVGVNVMVLAHNSSN